MSKNEIGLLLTPGGSKIGNEVDSHLQNIYRTQETFIVPSDCPRFGNGEAKGLILESVRGKDIYIIGDVTNWSCTYKLYGNINHYGPDEHFFDILRLINATRDHVKSITVIEPFLYASRQHRRKKMESLDCAMALQLLAPHVQRIIICDAHDANVEQAIPYAEFQNIYPTNFILRQFLNDYQSNISLDNKDLAVIAPDAGATDRARYYADILRCPFGICSKRRDYSKIEDGKNPIIGHDYVGPDIANKTAIIVDDMISSGDSLLEVAHMLKEKGASHIFAFVSFALFVGGIEHFQNAADNHIIDRIYATNLSYVPQEFINLPWFQSVDLTPFLAEMIYHYQQQISLSSLLDGRECTMKMQDSIVSNQKKLRQYVR